MIYFKIKFKPGRTAGETCAVKMLGMILQSPFNLQFVLRIFKITLIKFFVTHTGHNQQHSCHFKLQSGYILATLMELL